MKRCNVNYHNVSMDSPQHYLLKAALCNISRMELEENSDFRGKRTRPNLHRELDRKHTGAQREQLLLRDAICILSLDFSLHGGALLNNDNLFLLIGSYRDVVRLSNLSVTNASYCASPISSIFFIVSPTLVSSMLRVSSNSISSLGSYNDKLYQYTAYPNGLLLSMVFYQTFETCIMYFDKERAYTCCLH